MCLHCPLEHCSTKWESSFLDAQWLGRRALNVPAYKKSDDPDQEAKLVTLYKWKGELFNAACDQLQQSS